jgi:hypothetical protein
MSLFTHFKFCRVLSTLPHLVLILQVHRFIECNLFTHIPVSSLNLSAGTKDPRTQKPRGPRETVKLPTRKLRSALPEMGRTSSSLVKETVLLWAVSRLCKIALRGLHSISALQGATDLFQEATLQDRGLQKLGSLARSVLGALMILDLASLSPSTSSSRARWSRQRA